IRSSDPHLPLPGRGPGRERGNARSGGRRGPVPSEWTAARNGAHAMSQSTPHLHRRDLRPLVGRRVAVVAAGEHVHGVLLSCTASSLWLVEDDEDRIVALSSVATVSAVAA